MGQPFASRTSPELTAVALILIRISLFFRCWLFYLFDLENLWWTILSINCCFHFYSFILSFRYIKLPV